MGFQRLGRQPVCNLRLKIEKATAPRRREGPRRHVPEISAEGLDFLFLLCSSESRWEVTHDDRETTRSDPALESAQEARGPGRGRTPHPDPRMLFGEGRREARGLKRNGQSAPRGNNCVSSLAWAGLDRTCSMRRMREQTTA